jgi:hypothetical protein
VDETMTAMRTTALVLAVAATVLAGCGRKNNPIPPVAEGQPPRPQVIAPGDDGLARGPGIVPPVSDTIVPDEITRHPNAERRPFILDGLLN